MSTKPKTIVSPAGIASYPWLNTPDTKFPKANSPKGQYRVSLILNPDAEGVQDFLNSLEKASNDAKDENTKKNPKQKGFNLHFPFCKETDKDGNETGNIVVKFSSNASYINKKKDNEVTDIRPPFLFDAKRKPITSKIGGGSKIKIGFFMFPYANASAKDAGVSLRIEAVQVLDLKEWAGASAESMGFGEEEGYAAETAPVGAAAGENTQDSPETGEATGGDF